jgi:hypothetical protein
LFRIQEFNLQQAKNNSRETHEWDGKKKLMDTAQIEFSRMASMWLLRGRKESRSRLDAPT